MGKKKVSFFEAIGMAKPEPVEAGERPETQSRTKVIRFPRAYIAPRAKHRFEASELGAAWQRILDVELNNEATARHLARLEQWSAVISRRQRDGGGAGG